MVGDSMTAISRWLRRRASGLALGLAACGGRAARPRRRVGGPGAGGPPGPGDRAGDRRPAAARYRGRVRDRRAAGSRPAPRAAREHRLRPGRTFPRPRSPTAAGRCGQSCGPAPACTGWTCPPACRSRDEASVSFNYARYFAAPARARKLFGADARLRARARGGPGAERQPARAASLDPAGQRRAARRLHRAGALPGGRGTMSVGLRALRRQRRRQGGGMVPVTRAGRARRRHPGDRLRQAPPRAVRLPAGVARGGRAVGTLHLPRHRARARCSATGDGRSRGGRPGDGVGGGGARRRAAGAPGPNDAPLPAGRGAGPASVHRGRGRLPRLRRRPHHRAPARRAAR